MEELNIVELIEKNPITKLSSNYNNKLLNKIKEKFTELEQKLFVSSFYCYLKYDKNKDFIIDLDNIWEWIGFAQKVKAKALLEKNFIINKDYINSAFPVGKANIDGNNSNNNENRGGHNKQIFLMTIKCFKSLCLKAQTEKANRIKETVMRGRAIKDWDNSTDTIRLEKDLADRRKDWRKDTKLVAEYERKRQNFIKEQTLEYGADAIDANEIAPLPQQ